MRYLKIAILILSVFLLACTGKEKLPTDHTAPTTPILIPHLGDTPDTTSFYNNQLSYLNEDDNGIDAVPDDDWFRISWVHLIDTDLDYIKIYRFDEEYNQIALIDSISHNHDYYVDDTDTLYTNRKYYYFIEVVDQSGNKAVSDTVGYKLLSKQILTRPDYGEVFNPVRDSLCWQKSGFVSKFRLMIFDADHNHLWHRDIQVAFEQNYFAEKVPVNLFSNYSDDYFYWRVDAFDYDYELNMYIGSESNERLQYLQGKHK
ncbi:MAG: hypothetical protein ACE14O_01895 [Candidatus Cloacimonadaceae bacterium]